MMMCADNGSSLTALLYQHLEGIEEGESFVRYLNSNKLGPIVAALFPSLLQSKVSFGKIPNEFIEARICFEASLELLASIASKRGIRLMLLKHPTEFPFVNRDVDVLTQSREEDAVLRSELRLNGFSKWRANTLRFWHPANEPHKELWGRERFSVIHIHEAVAWDGVVYMGRNLLFQEPRQETVFNYPFFFPNNKDELAIQVAHIIFEKGSVDLVDLLHIAWLAEQVSLSEALLDYLWGRRPGTWVLEWILKLFRELRTAGPGCPRFPVALPKWWIWAARASVAAAGLREGQISALRTQLRAVVISLVHGAYRRFCCVE
jgi:hypothetical protein